MKKFLKLLHILFLSTFIVFSVNATETVKNAFIWPTQVPETKTLRLVESKKLSLMNETKENLKTLAIINAVIALEDKNTFEEIEKAIEGIKKVRTLSENDAELMAVEGNLLTAKAKFSSTQALASLYAKKGIYMIDQAVKKDPNDIGALLWRGINSQHLPIFYGRIKSSISDFETILAKTNSDASPQFKSMILYYLGVSYYLDENKTQAKITWKKSENINAGYWSNEAKQKLKLS